MITVIENCLQPVTLIPHCSVKIPVPLDMSNLRYDDDTCNCGVWHTVIIHTPLLTSVVVIQHTIRPIYILFFTLFRLLSSLKEKILIKMAFIFSTI